MHQPEHIERFDPESAPSPLMVAEHLARYRTACAFAPGARVLDAGCGTGYGSALLARAGATEVLGVDIDAEVVKDASNRHGGERVRFASANLLAFDADVGQFDLVVCFEVLEHLLDPAGVLGALRARLAPGGVLVCSVPNAAEEVEDNPFHLVDFDLDKFAALLHAEFAWATVVPQTRGVLSVVNMHPDPDAVGVDPPGPSVEPAVAYVGIAADHAVPLPPTVAVAAPADDLRYWIGQGLATIGEQQRAREDLERGYRDLEVALGDALAAAADRMVELGRVQRDAAATAAERDTHARRAGELTRELVSSETRLAEHVETIAALRLRLEDLERQGTEDRAGRDQQAREVQRLAAELEQVAAHGAAVQVELLAMRRTLSWRVTRGLRFVRRLLPSSSR